MKWYLTTYFDTSNTSIESTVYSEDEIQQYINPKDFNLLKINKMISFTAPTGWNKEYRVYSYNIKEI